MKDIRQKKNKDNLGMILIDILLALSLATIFVMILAESSVTASNLFASAKSKAGLLKVYEAHENDFLGMMPHESLSTADGDYRIEAAARWYGNDRIETDVTISGRQVDPLSFVAVRSYPFIDDLKLAGTSLCSVDFSNKEVVGSYEYLRKYDLGAASSSGSVLNDVDASNIQITPIVLPIDPLLSLTDLEVRNGVAYISADSSIANDPDLLVVDIKDPADPIIRSSVNTGPGIASLALAGDHIYSAATSVAGQLHVIKLANTDGLAGPNMLTIEKKYKLPPPYATATEPLASSIFFNDEKVYLGTEKWDGEEFSVIDVSIPSSPTKTGGLEIGSKVNDIFVRRSSPIDIRAYIATAAQNQLIEVDADDSAHPIIKDQLSLSGWQRQEGKVVSSFENGLSFGRTSGGYDVSADHEIFVWQGTSTIPTSLNMPGGVYGMIADRSRTFLISRQTDREFQIFGRDLSVSASSTISLSAAPQTLTCDGDKLYVLAKTAPIIYQVTFN